ncbi:MAG: PQQ-dependent catabolism-associated CXXCW motif protein [Alphaproteobacteria bacterium]|nr:PQQ-dependent catabolism-associated CXXCW motif protein [Alphaproteobacteria bacterium]
MRCRLGALAALLLCLTTVPAFGAEARPPEPDGYRLDDYRTPTPETINGRKPLGTTEAHRIWAAHAAIFIDVLPAPRRPDGLPQGAIWAPRPRLDIPDSIWLPDVGRGGLSPEFETWFRASLERLTAGDKTAPLVFYCLADCWMSWNATKRALSWGYAAAQWYEEGTDGWEVAGFPLAAALPPADMPR